MKLIFTQLFMVFILMSCHKDERVFIPDQTYILNSEILLATINPKPSAYILQLQNGKTVFTGHKDVIIELPNESLADSLGNRVTGRIKLEIGEFVDKKSHLLSSPSTIFDDQIIDVEKVLYLKFSKDGKDLFIKDAINIFLTAGINTTIKSNQIILGKTNGETIVWTNHDTNEIRVESGSWNVSDGGESNIKVQGYKIETLGAANWYSIYNQIPGGSNGVASDLKIESDNHINNKNTIAYFVSDHTNSVFKLSWSEEAGFFIPNSVPTDPLSGKILLLSQFGDDIFQFGMTNVVLGVDKSARITSSSVEINEIKSILQSL